MRVRFALLSCVAIVFASLGCTRRAPPEDDARPVFVDEHGRRIPFERAHREFVTRLTRRDPAPQPHGQDPAPAGTEIIHYDSGVAKLFAYWGVPAAAKTAPVPALVYLHGGFALDGQDVESVRSYLEMGFAVLTPSYRGENGNPGSFELFCGEVDDAANAVRWVAARREVDPKRIFVFGHSAGAAIASLLTLLPNLPIRLAGGAGGLYEQADLKSWKAMGWTPFDSNDRRELSIRVLGPHLLDIHTPFVAYSGADDRERLSAARLVARGRDLGEPITHTVVAGSHLTCLPEALVRFRTLALESASVTSR